MVVGICVILWARPGAEQAVHEYEDRVLGLLGRHDGRLLTRLRVVDDGPCEIQVIEFASEKALADFQRDPDRAALSALRDRAIERTQLIRVERVGPTE